MKQHGETHRFEPGWGERHIRSWKWPKRARDASSRRGVSEKCFWSRNSPEAGSKWSRGEKTKIVQSKRQGENRPGDTIFFVNFYNGKSCKTLTNCSRQSRWYSQNTSCGAHSRKTKITFNVFRWISYPEILVTQQKLSRFKKKLLKSGQKWPFYQVCWKLKVTKTLTSAIF